MKRYDPAIKVHKRPHFYFSKVYSTAPNTWFHDLLDNGDYEDTPRYWHVFVGVNTRYLVTYPLQGKSNADVQQSLQQFISKYHPEKLTSDEEPAFTSKATCKLCSDNNVKLFIVTGQQHSSLGVIDRVIRTLRDMNTPKAHHEQSHHEKFLRFSQETMETLVQKYNNRYNRTIKCTPKEMFEDKNKEIDFIYQNQEHKHNQRGIKDFRLKDGDFVRYRLQKDPLVKRRYRYSPESYKVAGRERSFYIIQAQDGSSLLMPRWKLIKCDVNVYPWKTTIPGNKKAIIDRIVSYNPRNDSYNVLFRNDPQEYILTRREIRHRTPQVMTYLEKEFFNRRN